jgi:hypothetical protein
MYIYLWSLFFLNWRTEFNVSVRERGEDTSEYYVHALPFPKTQKLDMRHYSLSVMDKMARLQRTWLYYMVVSKLTNTGISFFFCQRLCSDREAGEEEKRLFSGENESWQGTQSNLHVKNNQTCIMNNNE